MMTKSLTGKTEFDLRKLVVEQTDYRLLQRLRLVRYLGYPQIAVQIEDFNFTELAQKIVKAERLRDLLCNEMGPRRIQPE